MSSWVIIKPDWLRGDWVAKWIGPSVNYQGWRVFRTREEAEMFVVEWEMTHC